MNYDMLRMWRVMKCRQLVFGVAGFVILVWYLLGKQSMSEGIKYGLSYIRTEMIIRSKYGDRHTCGEDTVPRDAVWQAVPGTHEKFLVYSAHIETRRGIRRSVRVLGSTSLLTGTIWCCMHYNSSEPAQSVLMVLADIELLNDHHNTPFRACFVMCPLPDDMAPPDSVSILSSLNTTEPCNRLVVNSNSVATSTPRKLAVCLSPMFNNYNQALHLIEFIEMYSLLGAEHFYFYVHSASSQVLAVLTEYEDRGVVTLLTWELEPVANMHSHGQQVAINDCVYRTRGVFHKVAVVDTDEFIIPRQSDSLLQLMEILDKEIDFDSSRKAPIGSYNFRNRFFFISCPSDQMITDPFQTNLQTLTKTLCTTKIFPCRERSKYIAKPDYVVQAGIHFVWSFLPAFQAPVVVYVRKKMALLHHYRIGDSFLSGECILKDMMFDNTTHRFKDRLAKRVSEMWLDLTWASIDTWVLN